MYVGQVFLLQCTTRRGIEYHAAQRLERARGAAASRCGVARCNLSFRVQGKIEESLEMLKTTLKLKPDHEKGQAKLKQAKKAEKAKIAVRALKLERTRPTDRLWRLCGRSRCGWNCRHSRSKWMTPSRRPRRCKGEESYSTHSTVPHPLRCTATLASLRSLARARRTDTQSFIRGAYGTSGRVWC